MTGREVRRRVALGIGAVALILLSVVPTQGIDDPDRRGSSGREVSCGSIFVRTEWSRLDKCEAQIMGRVGLIGLVVLAAFVMILLCTIGLAFTSSRAISSRVPNDRSRSGRGDRA